MWRLHRECPAEDKDLGTICREGHGVCAVSTPASVPRSLKLNCDG